MMQSFSVVIICKNEAGIINRCLQSVQGLSDNIAVYDNGSTDGTQNVVKSFGADLYEGSWDGFGKTKQRAAGLAKHDWILNLDADEALDDELRKVLSVLKLGDEKIVYKMRFKNFLGTKYLRYGEWGNDKHIRLFNKKIVHWDDAPVHESLVPTVPVRVELLSGFVLHQTVKDIAVYSQKTVKYGLLNAEKYYQQGKKSSWFKILFAPRFAFIKYYIFRRGFLDGWEGLVCARMTSFYTFIKYSRLRELWRQGKVEGRRFRV